MGPMSRSAVGGMSGPGVAGPNRVVPRSDDGCRLRPWSRQPFLVRVAGVSRPGPWSTAYMTAPGWVLGTRRRAFSRRLCSFSHISPRRREMEMLEELQALQEKALAELEGVADLTALEEWRMTYLGRKGRLTQLLRGVGRLPPQERPLAGRRANEVKAALGAAYEARVEALKREELERELEAERIDVTLPGRPIGPGRLHLSTQILREIYAIFAQMGFQVVEGPEVELDDLNFTLLNMPPYHPAREMQDTFYTTDPDVLLRTHTS
ncbi:MAG TPA: hypothetical protein EYP55_06765, partial [Anaerolineae bacterium]|nr:hypothetical protein [Anaerolineae bacterium]